MLKELDVGFIFLALSFENLLYHHYEVYKDVTFCGYKIQTEQSVSLKELLIPVCLNLMFTGAKYFCD